MAGLSVGAALLAGATAPFPVGAAVLAGATGLAALLPPSLVWVPSTKALAWAFATFAGWVL